MFTLVISTALFGVENGIRRDMLSLNTTSISGFANAILAQAAAGGFRVDIPGCDRRAWAVQVS